VVVEMGMDKGVNADIRLDTGVGENKKIMKRKYCGDQSPFQASLPRAHDLTKSGRALHLENTQWLHRL
jgi:hypothetical protein